MAWCLAAVQNNLLQLLQKVHCVCHILREHFWGETEEEIDALEDGGGGEVSTKWGRPLWTSPNEMQTPNIWKPEEMAG